MAEYTILRLGLLLVLGGGLVALVVWLIVRLTTRQPDGGTGGARTWLTSRARPADPSPPRTPEAAPLTPDDFFAALERHLHARHIDFDAADLLAWARAVWPVAQDDPDPGHWASAYAVALAEAVRSEGGPVVTHQTR